MSETPVMTKMYSGGYLYHVDMLQIITILLPILLYFTYYIGSYFITFYKHVLWSCLYMICYNNGNCEFIYIIIYLNKFITH